MDMFRAAVEACPAAMILVDGEGFIRHVNAECERMFGYERGRLIGAPVDGLVPMPAREGHRARRAGFATAPSKRRMGEGRDLTAVRADGSEFPCEIGLTPIVDGGVLAFVIDITARRADETAMRTTLAQLERANDSLASFAHVASHDIQEPLRKIAAFADLLGSALRSGEVEEALYAADVMASSARHARRLVQDVMTLAKAHETDLVRRIVGLRSIVEAVLTTLSQTIAESGAVISVDVGDLAVDCDPIQTERLVTNLVSNGLKFHRPETAPVVRITARVEADGKLHLIVADEGIGFARERAAEIFLPFKRLHERDAYAGAGIGLAICKTIVDHHGWGIAVESAETMGTRFDVRMAAA